MTTALNYATKGWQNLVATWKPLQILMIFPFFLRTGFWLVMDDQLGLDQHWISLDKQTTILDTVVMTIGC